MPAAPTAIVDALQASCRLHLTAVEHYTSLAAHLERWGYAVLAERFRADAKEERGHLRLVMERLEYFDVAPALDHKLPSWPRHDYAGILTANLLLETAAAAVERANIAVSREVGDEQTALVFVTLLAGSERSVLEIEAAKQIVEEIGLDNYLATFVS
jgi:bacterioferritin